MYIIHFIYYIHIHVLYNTYCDKLSDMKVHPIVSVECVISVINVITIISK